MVQQFNNALKDFLLREDYFPLTLALSPIGGEGKGGTDLLLCHQRAATSFTPSPPASGGEGWGEGGRTTACKFLSGHCLGKREKGEISGKAISLNLFAFCRLMLFLVWRSTMSAGGKTKNQYPTLLKGGLEKFSKNHRNIMTI